MKFLSILVVAFSLSGCFYQTVNQYDLKDAIKVCGSLENIAQINSGFGGDESVICNDSTKFYLHERK